MAGPSARTFLDDISTRWSLVGDPVQFVLRYAPAVRRYLAALVPDPHDAEDVAQAFLLRLVGRPFTPEQVRGGRFRDYLKAVLRNEALTHFRRQSARGGGPATGLDLDQVPDAESAADRAWVAQWRECLLHRAWAALEAAADQPPGKLAFLALRLAADHPDEDSAALAARTAAALGHPVRADAYRKQLSRARRRFAQMLVHEVRQTLQQPAPADVVEELGNLGLLGYVRDYLPEPFRGAAR